MEELQQTHICPTLLKYNTVSICTMDDIVQCPYNPFHMCLVTRLPRHMWKCHNKEYMRDLDVLQERYKNGCISHTFLQSNRGGRRHKRRRNKRNRGMMIIIQHTFLQSPPNGRTPTNTYMLNSAEIQHSKYLHNGRHRTVSV
jgi:hypothetical protein